MNNWSTGSVLLVLLLDIFVSVLVIHATFGGKGDLFSVNPLNATTTHNFQGVRVAMTLSSIPC